MAKKKAKTVKKPKGPPPATGFHNPTPAQKQWIKKSLAERGIKQDERGRFLPKEKPKPKKSNPADACNPYAINLSEIVTTTQIKNIYKRLMTELGSKDIDPDDRSRILRDLEGLTNRIEEANESSRKDNVDVKSVNRQILLMFGLDGDDSDD